MKVRSVGIYCQPHREAQAILYVMAKIMKMNNQEQNQIAMYLYNSIMVIWSIIFEINFIRCKQLKKPILMKSVYIKSVLEYIDVYGNKNTCSPIYFEGLGYTIRTEIDGSKIIENRMYVFDKLLSESSIIRKEK